MCEETTGARTTSIACSRRYSSEAFDAGDIFLNKPKADADVSNGKVLIDVCGKVFLISWPPVIEDC